MNTQRDIADTQPHSAQSAGLADSGPAAGGQSGVPTWPGWPRATAQAIRFYSRLPVPALPGEADPHAAPDFRLMPRALPVAGLVIALPAMVCWRLPPRSTCR